MIENGLKHRIIQGLLVNNLLFLGEIDIDIVSKGIRNKFDVGFIIVLDMFGFFSGVNTYLFGHDFNKPMISLIYRLIHFFHHLFLL